LSQPPASCTIGAILERRTDLNLLTHRIVDIVFQEGARFSVSEENGGRERVESATERVLKEKGFDPETITVEMFRLFYHDGWQELVDLLCPADTHLRVKDRFYQLIFS
jgi:hypothetical protein